MVTWFLCVLTFWCLTECKSTNFEVFTDYAAAFCVQNGKPQLSEDINQAFMQQVTYSRTKLNLVNQSKEKLE